jgi:hypothetical protein
MPLYTFKSKETGEFFEFQLKISELDSFKQENPNLEIQLSTPSFGDSVRLGIRKPDDGFKDILRNVKKKHIRSTVNIP